MDATQTLKIRTDLARQMGQKAEAMRREVEVETYRYEGALGCLKQLDEELGRAMVTVRGEVDGGQTPLETAQHIMEGLKRATAVVATLGETARQQLASVKGRLAQSEKTLDMLEAVFAADIAQAQRMVAHTEAPAATTGRHPGPSLAEQRRAEAVIEASTVDVPEDGSGEDVAE